MSKISTALRAAALGPAPAEHTLLGDWVEDDYVFCSASDYVDRLRSNATHYLNGFTEDECRLFLLFVAEAVESEE